MEKISWQDVLREWVNCLKISPRIYCLQDLKNGDFFNNLDKIIEKEISGQKESTLKCLRIFLTDRYKNIKLRNVDHPSALTVDDLEILTSLLMHYTCIYDRRDVLTSPLCYALSQSTQVYIRDFLEKIDENITNDELKAVTKNVISSKIVYKIPLKTPASPLQQILKSPISKGGRFQEKDRDIAKLKLELENEKDEKAFLQEELNTSIEKNKKLETQLEQKRLEISRLRSEVAELESRTPPQFQDTNSRDTQKRLKIEIEGLENYVHQLERDEESLRKEKDQYKEKARKLEIEYSTFKEKYIESEKSFSSLKEQFSIQTMQLKTLQANYNELNALLEEYKASKSEDSSLFDTSIQQKNLQSTCENLATSVVEVQLRDAQKQNDELKSILEMTRRTTEEINEKYSTLENDNQSLLVKINEATHLLKSYEMDLSSANATIKEYETSILELKKEVEVLENENLKLNEELSGSRQKNQNLITELNDLANANMSLKKDFDEATKETEMVNLETQRIQNELNQEISELKIKLDILQNEKSTELNKNRELEQCMQEAEGKILRITKVKEELETKLTEAELLNSKNQTDIVSLQKSEDSLNAEIQHLNCVVKNLNADHEKVLEMHKIELSALGELLEVGNGEIKRLENQLETYKSELNHLQDELERKNEDLKLYSVVCQEITTKIGEVGVRHQNEELQTTNEVANLVTLLISNYEIVVAEKHAIEKETKELRTQLQTQSADLLLKGEGLRKLNLALTEMNDKLQELEKQNKNLLHELGVSSKENQARCEEINSLHQDVTNFVKSLENQDQIIRNFEMDVSHLTVILGNCANFMEQFTMQSDAFDLIYNEKVLDLEKRLLSITHNCQKYQKIDDGKTKIINTLHKEVNQLKTENENLESQMVESNLKIVELMENIKNKSVEIDNKSGEIQTLQQKIGDLEESAVKRNAEKNDLLTIIESKNLELEEGLAKLNLVLEERRNQERMNADLKSKIVDLGAENCGMREDILKRTQQLEEQVKEIEQLKEQAEVLQTAISQRNSVNEILLQRRSQLEAEAEQSSTKIDKLVEQIDSLGEELSKSSECIHFLNEQINKLEGEKTTLDEQQKCEKNRLNQIIQDLTSQLDENVEKFSSLDKERLLLQDNIAKLNLDKDELGSNLQDKEYQLRDCLNKVALLEEEKARLEEVTSKQKLENEGQLLQKDNDLKLLEQEKVSLEQMVSRLKSEKDELIATGNIRESKLEKKEESLHLLQEENALLNESVSNQKAEVDKLLQQILELETQLNEMEETKRLIKSTNADLEKIASLQNLEKVNLVILQSKLEEKLAELNEKLQLREEALLVLEKEKEQQQNTEKELLQKIQIGVSQLTMQEEKINLLNEEVVALKKTITEQNIEFVEMMERHEAQLRNTEEVKTKGEQRITQLENKLVELETEKVKLIEEVELKSLEYNKEVAKVQLVEEDNINLDKAICQLHDEKEQLVADSKHKDKEINKQIEENQSLQKELDELAKEKTTLEKQCLDLRDDYIRLTKALSHKNDELDTLVRNMRKKKQEVERELEHLKLAIFHGASNVEDLDVSLETDLDEIDKLDQNISKIDAFSNLVDEKEHLYIKEISSLKEELNNAVANHVQLLQVHDEVKIENETQIQQLTENLHNMVEKYNNLEKHHEELVKTAKEQNEILLTEKRDFEDRVQRANAEIFENSTQLNQLRDSLLEKDNTIELLRGQIDEKTEEVSSLQNELACAMKEVEDLEHISTEKAKEIERINTMNTHITNEMRKLKDETQATNENNAMIHSELQYTIDNKNMIIKDLEMKKEDLNNQINILNQELEVYKHQLNIAVAELKEFQARSNEALQKQTITIEGLEKDVIRLKQNKAALENAKTSLETRCEELQSEKLRLIQLEESNESLHRKTTREKDEQLDKLKKEKLNLEESLANKEREIIKYKQELCQIEQSLKNLQLQKDNLESLLHDKKEEDLNKLEKIEKHYEIILNEHKGTFDNLKLLNEKITTELNTSKIETRTLQENLTQLLEEKQDLERELLDTNANLRSQLHQIKNLEDTIKTNESIIAENQQVIEDQKAAISSLKDKNERLLTDIESLKEDLFKIKKNRDDILHSQKKIIKETEINIHRAHENAIEVKNDLLKRIELVELEKANERQSRKELETKLSKEIANNATMEAKFLELKNSLELCKVEMDKDNRRKLETEKRLNEDVNQIERLNNEIKELKSQIVDISGQKLNFERITSEQTEELSRLLEQMKLEKQQLLSRVQSLEEKNLENLKVVKGCANVLIKMLSEDNVEELDEDLDCVRYLLESAISKVEENKVRLEDLENEKEKLTLKCDILAKERDEILGKSNQQLVKIVEEKEDLLRQFENIKKEYAKLVEKTDSSKIGGQLLEEQERKFNVLLAEKESLDQNIQELVQRNEYMQQVYSSFKLYTSEFRQKIEKMLSQKNILETLLNNVKVLMINIHKNNVWEFSNFKHLSERKETLEIITDDIFKHFGRTSKLINEVILEMVQFQEKEFDNILSSKTSDINGISKKFNLDENLEKISDLIDRTTDALEQLKTLNKDIDNIIGKQGKNLKPQKENILGVSTRNNSTIDKMKEDDLKKQVFTLKQKWTLAESAKSTLEKKLKQVREENKKIREQPLNLDNDAHYKILLQEHIQFKEEHERIIKEHVERYEALQREYYRFKDSKNVLGMNKQQKSPTEKEFKLQQDLDQLREAYSGIVEDNSKLKQENLNLMRILEERKSQLGEFSLIKEAYEKLLEENNKLMTELDTIKYKRSRDRDEFVRLLKKERDEYDAKNSRKVQDIKSEYEAKLEKMKDKMIKLYRDEVSKEMSKAREGKDENESLMRIIRGLKERLFESEKQIHMLEAERNVLRRERVSSAGALGASRESLASILSRESFAPSNRAKNPETRSLMDRHSIYGSMRGNSRDQMETVQYKRTYAGDELPPNVEDRRASTLPKARTIVEEEITLSRRTSIGIPSNLGQSIQMEDEDEMFNNKYLADLQEGRCDLAVDATKNRFSELAWRNSLLPPHLKSSYPAESQFLSPGRFKDDDIKSGNVGLDDSLCKLLPGEKPRKKDFGTTSYKKPGPPTPSKNGGRLSLQGNEVHPLRELHGPKTPKRSTPNRIKALFVGKAAASMRHDSESQNNGTPKSKRLSIFRKPK